MFIPSAVYSAQHSTTFLPCAFLVCRLNFVADSNGSTSNYCNLQVNIVSFCNVSNSKKLGFLFLQRIFTRVHPRLAVSRIVLLFSAVFSFLWRGL